MKTDCGVADLLRVEADGLLPVVGLGKLVAAVVWEDAAEMGRCDGHDAVHEVGFLHTVSQPFLKDTLILEDASDIKRQPHHLPLHHVPSGLGSNSIQREIRKMMQSSKTVRHLRRRNDLCMSVQ